MISSWFSRKKRPDELVASLKQKIALAEAAAPGPPSTKASDEVSKAIASIKVMLFGENETAAEPENAEAFAKMAAEEDLLMRLASHLKVMAFETRKDAVQIFNNLLKGDLTESQTVLDAISEREGTELTRSLMAGYDSNETALVSGAMLRECLRNEAMTKKLLDSPDFWKLFGLVEVSDFDVASDAYATFKDILTRHTSLVATFMDEQYDPFFNGYNALLRSDNYVARRQSLKLLGELLMERSNFKIMTKYIASADNLKLIMNLLLDRGKHIQFEAFHVFKIFVANPKKSPQVQAILIKNRSKLVVYMRNFLTEREDDQFHEERLQMIDEIQNLGTAADE